MADRKPDPAWDRVHFSNYRMTLLSADHWRRHANALLRAAELVEAEVREVWQHNMTWLKNNELRTPRKMRPRASEIFGVHFMLVAFVVENLLKAALVRRHQHELRTAFERSGKLPTELKSHNLFVLARKAGIAVDVETEDLLRRLTRAAVWAGRYPVPAGFRESSSDEEFADGKEWLVSYFSESDPERLTQLIARLKNDLGAN